MKALKTNHLIAIIGLMASKTISMKVKAKCFLPTKSDIKGHKSKILFKILDF
jgi:hypothetical protein